jgi:hypothetical protein
MHWSDPLLCITALSQTCSKESRVREGAEAASWVGKRRGSREPARDRGYVLECVEVYDWGVCVWYGSVEKVETMSE